LRSGHPVPPQQGLTTASAATENRMSIATFTLTENQRKAKCRALVLYVSQAEQSRITSTLSCKVILCATSHLVIRSSVTIRPAIRM